MALTSITDNDGADTRNTQATIADIQVVNAFAPSVDLKVPFSHPMVDPTRGPSISASADHASDGASIRTVPVVPVAEPSSSTTPGISGDAQVARCASPTSATETDIVRADDALSSERRARRRSTIESRSPNRLSGFFTNLISRRETTPAPAREPDREPVSQSEPARPNSEDGSSPTPPRPTTPPPPSLPAPTLPELGLSLVPLSTDLCPSHFTSPPSNGAFLAPHYLLLCHPQGLDVLPLLSPPAIQPYALVRRVNFKCAVVMEHRGVLVAIAGRRAGVRVYALEEIRKAIEWRIDVEIKREHRQRRDNTTSRLTPDNWDRNSRPGGSEPLVRNISRHNSSAPSSPPSTPPPLPLIPRSATRKKKFNNAAREVLAQPSEHPPPYVGATEVMSPSLQSQRSYISLSRARGNSVSNVLGRAATLQPDTSRNQDNGKVTWADSSDDEAIDALAAGPSGSHLDERTSATFSGAAELSVTSPRLGHTQTVSVSVPTHPSTSTSTVTSTTVRRHRPANLDLSAARPNVIPPPEPSPVPTLLTLRQALQAPLSNNGLTTASARSIVDVDDDDEELDGHISLAQALFESRLPNLPPMGTRCPQDPIIITPIDPNPRSSQVMPTPYDPRGVLGRRHSLSRSTRRRRRWFVMMGNRTYESDVDRPASACKTIPTSQSERLDQNQSTTSSVPNSETLALIQPSHSVSNSPRTSRFIPRIISNVLNGRSSDDRPTTSASLPELYDGSRWTPSVIYQIPPPKLEYVKLPGTKGAVAIKAVETPKKSFLAILCGEHGEKVELFAGTYRTALGLSRTFILPDSPRTLELQLQGDDLVELFLVFAQNVFGLEPATVRVREVRIGRAERRAARRRARENRTPGWVGDTQPEDAEPDEETNIGVLATVASHSVLPTPPNLWNERSEGRPTSPDPAPGSMQGEEFVLVTMAQTGAYTTFQQLNFAPRFPLASIADEFIIPPTYPSVVEYKATYEGENQDIIPTEIRLNEEPHFTPPGIPLPIAVVPSKWFYRDPRNIIHGPWKASLMEAWCKDGLLPPDLPVRREEDTEFVLLRELRLMCVDPAQPFRNSTPPTTPPLVIEPPNRNPEKPLLSPISLLAHPKHFGPPALFFSSRGGHSTAVVDSRGRSVLKGKLFWSGDGVGRNALGNLGDIKRLEAIDIRNRSVLVAFRQGGLEVVDLSDALLQPADESRPNLPNYTVPHSAIGRRAPYVWRMGSPISPTLSSVLTAKGKGTSTNPSVKAKFGNGRSDTSGVDSEIDQREEVLYMGRNGDEVYFCERNATSFRILRLFPTS